MAEATGLVVFSLLILYLMKLNSIDISITVLSVE